MTDSELTVNFNWSVCLYILWFNLTDQQDQMKSYYYCFLVVTEAFYQIHIKFVKIWITSNVMLIGVMNGDCDILKIFDYVQKFNSFKQNEKQNSSTSFTYLDKNGLEWERLIRSPSIKYYYVFIFVYYILIMQISSCNYDSWVIF